MSYRTDKLMIDGHTDTHTYTHTHTHAGNDNTRRPKLASGKNYIKGPGYNWQERLHVRMHGRICPW